VEVCRRRVATSKANRQLNFLKRNLKISSQQIKESLREYMSLVRPKLEYNSCVDYITIEILKADIETTTKHLEKLVNNIWEKEVVSSDWNKGLIVKISSFFCDYI
jgi:ubiquinone biosynthesis protein UbiJ